MNRRKFLTWLGATATAAGAALAPTLDLDKLLWQPGQKKIFIPEVVTPKHHEVFVVSGGDGYVFDGRQMSMRFIQEYEKASTFPTRLDVLYGWAVIPGCEHQVVIIASDGSPASPSPQR
jgi:hypothetical protein